MTAGVVVSPVEERSSLLRWDQPWPGTGESRPAGGRWRLALSARSRRAVPLGAGPPRTSRTPLRSAPLGAAVLAHPGRRGGPRLLRSVPVETGGKSQLWGNVLRPPRGQSRALCRWLCGSARRRVAAGGSRSCGGRNGAGPAAASPGRPLAGGSYVVSGCQTTLLFLLLLPVF